MLLSFLNKDPISASQQAGNNNDFVDSSVHTVSSNIPDGTEFNKIPIRSCILPVLNKLSHEPI